MGWRVPLKPPLHQPDLESPKQASNGVVRCTPGHCCYELNLLSHSEHDMAVRRELIAVVERGFALPLDGIHGQAHWRRVHGNGSRLAELNGADLDTVQLFAYLHDSRRVDDGWDLDHGRRAADFVESLQGSLLDLPAESLERLAFACAFHSDGLTEADITVQTCWDADRLDLGRIGIQPDPGRMCTSAARDPAIIRWAVRRSQAGR